MKSNAKYFIVGAGFFGCVVAERIANDLKENCVILEKREHIGGNCYSEFEAETKIEVHKYGTHIFHTSDKEVWEYLNHFSAFNSYRHKVLTKHHNKVFQMPINLSTINEFFNKSYTPSEARIFIQTEILKEKSENPANLEEMAISLIGRELFEAFIKGYTYKQWNTDLKKLPAEIIQRLPVRYNYKSDYFDDIYQGLPLSGYTGFFEKILDNRRIELHLKTDFKEVSSELPKDAIVIYTGAIDNYFDYKYGELGWRTVKLETEIVPTSDFQGTSVMNYADFEIPYTRIHEFKHLHEERKYSSSKSVISREFSVEVSKEYSEPYYPMNRREDHLIFQKYLSDAKKMKNIFFGGRLGTYAYLDMDKIVKKALLFYEDNIK